MTFRTKLAIAAGLLVLPLAAQRARTRAEATNVPETNPYASAADVEAGKRLFSGRCGHCHGQSGEGGRGATINSGRFRHGGSDRELFMVIRNGIPNTEMPGTFNLPEPEVWRMVAYVKQLGRSGGGDDPVSGDPLAGAVAYKKNGCAQCHLIGSSGGLVGPDLTDVGAKRAVRHLRQSITEPSKDIPLDYRTGVAVTKAGASVTGVHLNEDEYSVHLREMNGTLRSFMKRDLKELRLPLQSTMPAYAAMAKPDLDNLVAFLHQQRGGAAESLTWRFDRLTNIGGHKTTVLGEPKVVDSPIGKAVEFDGVDDALFIANHPLAGAKTFTLEAIFRPDGGQVEQRWFHLSELETDNRMLFELRVAGDKWYLDSFNQHGTASKALMNRTALHPLKTWHHVASVYDGKEFRNYVNGVQEGAAAIEFAPHAPGHASVGVRINKVFYFKGAVHSARFTPKALTPAEFLRVD